MRDVLERAAIEARERLLAIAAEELERRLAEFKQTEAVVVFQSGFAANAGTPAPLSLEAERARDSLLG